MNAAWVVVADTSRARIFVAEKPASPLMEIQTLTHPASRLHEGDLSSDRPGRDRNSTSGSHDLGNGAELKAEESAKFASTVCQTLECGRANNSFKQLHIIAAPAFLGTLRKYQSNPLQQMIGSEVAKNISTQDIESIRKNLPDFL